MFPTKTVIVAVSVAGLCTSAYVWHKKEVQQARVETQLAVANQYNAALIQLQKQKDEVQRELQNTITSNERKKNEEIRSINNRYNAIIASLRNRPDNRQTGESRTSHTGETPTETGATGLQLSRPDAEFLARFARDTAELQAELKACIRDYESVREIVNNFGE